MKETGSRGPEVGDRVNVTLRNRLVEVGDYGERYITHWGQKIHIEGAIEGGDVEVVTPPIVLPTGKTAIVMIGEYRYVRASEEEWISLGSQMRFASRTIQESAERNRGEYRVIFEGESE